MKQSSPEHAQLRPDVLVIGEALIDVITSEAGTREHPGGSPANVAYGLGKLGISTQLLTSIGHDARGTAIQRHLAETGVAVLPESFHNGTTGTAEATLLPDGSARYTFDIHWDLPEMPFNDPPGLVHTGSIAAFLAPGASKVKAMLERVAGHSLVTFDPNIRPALLGSHAQTVATFEDLAPMADTVKLSDEDAAWLYPGQDPEGVADAILALGTKVAILTLGGRGSYLATGRERLIIPSVPATVSDTVGAGDSFMATWIYGLISQTGDGMTKENLAHMARTASIAAAITVGRPGANPPTEYEIHCHPAWSTEIPSRAGCFVDGS